MQYYHSLYGWIELDNIQHPGSYGPSNCNQGIDSTPSLTELHNFSGSSPRVPSYDFSDGRDTGERHTLTRALDVDITEVEKRTEEISDDLEKAKESIENMQQQYNRLDS